MTYAGLFMGINSYNWDLNNFDAFINDAKFFGFNQVLVKVYEITQGDWYQNLGGSKVVVDHIRSRGIDCLPYGYFYGANPNVEINAAIGYLNTFGRFCMDMEAEFNNNNLMQPFHDNMMVHPGDLYLSTWANPVDQGWVHNVQLMDPLVKVWMPQVYNPYLVSVYQQQYAGLTGASKIQPTYSVNDTPIVNWTAPTFTAWDYGSIVSDGAAESAIRNLLTSPVLNTSMRTQFDNIWYNPASGVPAGYQSGIYKAVLAGFLAVKYSACYPISQEVMTVNWTHDRVIWQSLSNGCHAEYDIYGVTRIYAPSGALLFTK